MGELRRRWKGLRAHGFRRELTAVRPLGSQLDRYDGPEALGREDQRSALGDELHIVGVEKVEECWVLQEWNCAIPPSNRRPEWEKAPGANARAMVKGRAGGGSGCAGLGGREVGPCTETVMLARGRRPQRCPHFRTPAPCRASTRRRARKTQRSGTTAMWRCAGAVRPKSEVAL